MCCNCVGDPRRYDSCAGVHQYGRPADKSRIDLNTPDDLRLAITASQGGQSTVAPTWHPHPQAIRAPLPIGTISGELGAHECVVRAICTSG